MQFTVFEKDMLSFLRPACCGISTWWNLKNSHNKTIIEERRIVNVGRINKLQISLCSFFDYMIHGC